MVAIVGFDLKLLSPLDLSISINVGRGVDVVRGTVQFDPFVSGLAFSHQGYHRLCHRRTLLLQFGVTLGIASRIEVYLEEVDFVSCVDEEVEPEELKACVLVLDVRAAEDAVSDDMIDLLVVLTPQVA